MKAKRLTIHTNQNVFTIENREHIKSLSEVKIGRGSPICERVCKKLVENFKNNIPQCQIAKALQISSSTVHNIIKRFRETGEISVHKGQGQRPLLDTRGLRALRQHCITHRHDSVIGITKWAQEYFQKLLSVNTIPTICEHGPEAPSCPVGQGSFKMDCFKVEKCSLVRESKFDILVGNNGCHVLRAKKERDNN